MSKIYYNIVKAYINNLEDNTRYAYKSNLKRIFRAVEGRDPENDDELYYYPWLDLTINAIGSALIAVGHALSVNACVSTWRALLKEYQYRGVLNPTEADRLLSLPVAKKGWTTQPVPIDTLLPFEPSTNPNADSSRQRPVRELYPAMYQDTRPDVVRADEQESREEYRDTTNYRNPLVAWLLGAPKGSSAQLANAVAATTKAFRQWRKKTS